MDAPAADPAKHSILVPALLAGAVIGLGLAAGLLREGNDLTAVVLLSEPLPAVLGIGLVHLCFVSGRWLQGVFAAVAVALFLLFTRVAPALPMEWAPSAAAPAWVAPVQACASHVSLPSAWILAQWNGANDPGALRSLADIADVIVLVDPTVNADAALETAGGELRGVPGGALVWARAGFALCGDADAWAVGDHSALVFVAPGTDIAVPFVVSTLPLFGAALAKEVGAIADVARGVGDSALVVAASAGFPTSFSRTDQAFAAAGVRTVRLPPNAPAAIGPLPLLTLRPVNRVWASSRWAVRGQRAPGGSAVAAPMIVRFDYQMP
jgi:hypothetical protein